VLELEVALRVGDEAQAQLMFLAGSRLLRHDAAATRPPIAIPAVVSAPADAHLTRKVVVVLRHAA
jgi:hypothetical protein